MIFNDGEEKTGAVCKPGALLCSCLQGRRQTEKRSGAGCSAPLSRGGSVGAALHSKPYLPPTLYTGGGRMVRRRPPPAHRPAIRGSRHQRGPGAPSCCRRGRVNRWGRWSQRAAGAARAGCSAGGCGLAVFRGLIRDVPLIPGPRGFSQRLKLKYCQSAAAG